MATRGNRPPSDRSVAEDAIIFETLERAPDYVVRVIAQIAERFQAEGYTAEEVEGAALQLCRELGISRTVN